MLVAPDMLGAGKPALIAVGVNNKLDGFSEHRSGDSDPVASFNYVPVIMVIDLLSMNGDKLIDLPQSNGRVPLLPLVLPYAYAYLDAATAPKIPRIDPKTKSVLGISLDNMLTLGTPRAIKCWPGATNEQCIEITMTRGQDRQGGGLFVLDANLSIKKFTPHATETVGSEVSYWSARFRPIVQEGHALDR